MAGLPRFTPPQISPGVWKRLSSSGFPFAVAAVRAAFDASKIAYKPKRRRSNPERLRSKALRTRLQNLAPTERVETTPGVEAPAAVRTSRSTSSWRPATGSSTARRSARR